MPTWRSRPTRLGAREIVAPIGAGGSALYQVAVAGNTHLEALNLTDEGRLVYVDKGRFWRRHLTYVRYESMAIPRW